MPRDDTESVGWKVSLNFFKKTPIHVSIVLASTLDIGAIWSALRDSTMMFFGLETDPFFVTLTLASVGNVIVTLALTAWLDKKRDAFASLLPTVEQIKLVRTSMRAGQDVHKLPVAVIQDDIAELATRLGAMGLDPAALSPHSGNLDPTLAVLSGYMKDRRFWRARKHLKQLASKNLGVPW